MHDDDTPDDMLEDALDADPLLLIIEDDDAFARTLARSFERRGYQVRMRWTPAPPCTPAAYSSTKC